MKTSFKYLSTAIILLSTISLLFVSSCSKDDTNKLQNGDRLSEVTISINASLLGTKIQHTYIENKLKTTWKESDQIKLSYRYGDFVYGGKVESSIFKLTDPIMDDGHTACFSGVFSDFPKNDDLKLYFYATYPVKFVSLAKQTGKIEDLEKMDMLLAQKEVSKKDISSISLQFIPICSVLRLPKNMLVTNADFSDTIHFTLSGENVADFITISSDSHTNSINKDFHKGEIVITTTVIKGKLADDVFVSFVPVDNEGDYIYYLESDKGDKFEFFKRAISTSKLYTVNTLSSGYLDLSIFDDENFKNYCLSNFDLNKDGLISYAEAKMAKKIDLTSLNIASLKGVELFENLTYLRCIGNYSNNKYRLSSLDISNNKALTSLDCSENKLTNLDISNNTSLKYLYCHTNKLTNLDASNNTDLYYLDCSHNQISQLNVSNNTDLYYLDCSQNQISQLNVSNSTDLAHLDCSQNQISQLDVTNNAALYSFSCGGNQLTNLDISNNTNLYEFNCGSNSIQALNINTKNLNKFYCSNNQLSTIDVSGCATLQQLNCADNKLTQLDVSNNTSLAYLYCYNNQLTSLDVSKCTFLIYFTCQQNLLTNLTLCQSDRLAYLDCRDNKLTSLEVPMCKIGSFYCSNNLLTTLDLSQRSQIDLLDCSSNKLANLDVSNIINLKALDCSTNLLTSLDVRSNINLGQLSCHSNKLTTLNVSKNTALKKLTAWPQTGTLSTLYIKKGQSIEYYKYENNTETRFYGSYPGTTIIEVN